jgi:hypothetical protein
LRHERALLTRLRKTKTHCKAFADDGALITCNKKLSEAMKDAQKAINVAVEWAKEMGGEFSVEKTVVMLFTNKRASSYQMPNSLKLYSQEIPFSKTAKYLGVTPQAKAKARVAHGRHLQHQFPAGLWQADTDEITHQKVCKNDTVHLPTKEIDMLPSRDIDAYTDGSLMGGRSGMHTEKIRRKNGYTPMIGSHKMAS